MTSEHLTRFVQQRPFEPFTFVTVDGREIQVRHPEHVSMGQHALSVTCTHPTGQIEIIDANLIVSIRTLYAADAADYSE